MDIQHRIAGLRKAKGITQTELAEHLGLSFQSISKWENGVCLPDISHLPKLAKYFQVTTDYILGVEKHTKDYIPRNTDKGQHWDCKRTYLKNTREDLWNDDYMKFLVQEVWALNKPCKIIDFGCGYGYLGLKLLPLLPVGSSYKGIDMSKALISEGRQVFTDSGYDVTFSEMDINKFDEVNTYDVAICQAVLRHLPNPRTIMNKMKDAVCPDGLVICMEVNRPFETIGTLVENLDYEPKKDISAYWKLWSHELAQEGRDYSIGLKLPILMSQLGLKNVDVRLNDKVAYLEPSQFNYDNRLKRLPMVGDYDKGNIELSKETIALLHNRGLDKPDIQVFKEVRSKIGQHVKASEEKPRLVHVNGILVAYGTK